MSNVKCQSGFTLIELVISVGIISALLALGIPAFRSYGLQVNFDAEASSIASLVEDARTLALAPEANKDAAVSSYGVSFDTSAQTAVLGRYDNSEPVPQKISEVKTSSIASNVELTKIPSSPILFPIHLQGEPQLNTGANEIVLTHVSLQTNPTRTLIIHEATGQVSIQ